MNVLVVDIFSDVNYSLLGTCFFEIQKPSGLPDYFFPIAVLASTVIMYIMVSWLTELIVCSQIILNP